MTQEEFLKEWNNDSDKLLVHTSGSTGSPKPLWVEKQRMLASARVTCDFLGLKSGDTALLCMPLDYIAGKMMVVRSIERGLRLISVPPSGHPLATLVGKSVAPVFAAMVPMQVYNSLQVPEERKMLREIRHLIIGGGAIEDRLARELRFFPNAVWSTYGMTETLSHIALRRLSSPGASEWYEPFDGVELSLTSDGCLVICAPAVCDHPLVTHDRAELLPSHRSEGAKVRFRILGRKDNVIDSGGIKIQIEEVEKALRPFLRMPFLITKKKDAKFGEAVVLLTEQTDMADMAEICMNALPNYWVPRAYIHVEKIPLTETGKPARAVAETLAARSASGVTLP